MDIVPDTGQLSQVMVQATAPAFILGAVAGFISILQGRMTSVIDRIRSLNEIADDDIARANLKSDIPRLRKRAKLLNSAIHLALTSGMCTSLLLVVGFGSAFFRLQHEYGAGGCSGAGEISASIHDFDRAGPCFPPAGDKPVARLPPALFRVPASAVSGEPEARPHPFKRPRRFCTRSALVPGAEMAESRGRTSGWVARRGPRLPRRNCATTVARARRTLSRLQGGRPGCVSSSKR